MFVTSVRIKTLISVSDTQNIVGEVFLYMGSIGLLEDMCVLSASSKERMSSSSINLMLVGAVVDGVEAFAVSWWCE